jgi:hypothetical protein
LSNSTGFGFTIAVLLGSGTFGFLFSTIHHWFQWLRWERFQHIHPGADHRRLLESLITAGVLHLVNGTNQSVHSLTRMQAWVIVTSLWHERLSGDNGIAAANRRADTLANLVHSLGAATVASVAAVPTTIIIAVHMSGVSWDFERLVATLVVASLLIAVHENSYRDTLSISQRFVEEVLADTLSKDKALPITTRALR